jgi:hypothetical protein
MTTASQLHDDIVQLNGSRKADRLAHQPLDACDPLPEATPSRLPLVKFTLHLLQRPLRPIVRRVFRAWIACITNHAPPTGRALVYSRSWLTDRRRRHGRTAPHEEPQEKSPSAQSNPHSRSFRLLGNHLLEVSVVQGECHPAYVFRKKRTGVPIHQEREFGSLGEHL